MCFVLHHIPAWEDQLVVAHHVQPGTANIQIVLATGQEELLARLVAFDTTSSKTNIPLIEFVEGYLAELHAPGVRSTDGLPLLHPEAYYTLNYIPTK